MTTAAIEKLLGQKADSQAGMVKVTIGRAGMMHGVKVAGSMGLTTWAPSPAAMTTRRWRAISS
ncbi:MAG: DUF1259 domain-containing protein [Gemmataceae bacterium]